MLVEILLDTVRNTATPQLPIVIAVIAFVAISPGVIWSVNMNTFGCLSSWARFKVTLGTFAKSVMLSILVRAVCVKFYFVYTFINDFNVLRRFLLLIRFVKCSSIHLFVSHENKLNYMDYELLLLYWTFPPFAFQSKKLPS